MVRGGLKLRGFKVEGLWPELFEDLRSEEMLTADSRGLVIRGLTRIAM
jgi:hypothetical protein